MNATRLFHRGGAIALLLALLGGCATPGRDLAQHGQQLVKEGQVEQGLAEIEKAVRAEPGNAEYRMLLVRERETQLNGLLGRADAARAQERFDDAQALYQRAAALSPDSERLRNGLDALARERRLGRRIDQAQALADQGQREDAAALLRGVLGEAPNMNRALALKRRLDDEAGAPPVVGEAPQLKPALRKPVTLDFRDANIKSAFEALSRATGINFVFDREVRPDIKVTLYIANMTIEDVVDVLTTTNQLGRKTLNDNTVLIYPATPAKQKEYQELMVKTFYLANAEAKTVITMLKTVLKSKDLYADERLNALVMRDTPDAVRLAEKLIAAQDFAEPEVLLDVEVLEIKRSRFLELGIDPPTSFTVLNIVKNPDTVISTATGNTTVQNNTTTTTQLTLDKLKGVSGSSVGINNPSATARQENGDANLLANPRIRAKNREKARILIGDRVPVITTTATANVGVSESVSYLDVGLKLEVEPNISLNNDVGVNVSLEVSSIVKEVKSKTGSLTYQIGTRMATTALRLKDGETQALAGLISDEDRRSASGLPGLTDVPVLGRLFSTERSDRNKTEIVLLLTPRVVRNLPAANGARYEQGAGTESAVGAGAMRLRSHGKLAGSPSRGGPGAAARTPGEFPATEAEPEPDVPAQAPAPAAVQ